MSLNIANCPRCGRIFAKSVKNLCPSCIREEEEMYEKVYQYLKDNPDSTVQEVSQGTGVSEEYILGFLRQDRLLSSGWTQLSYACERCGTDIKSGRYCDSCSAAMQQSLQAAAEDIQQKKQAGGGYHTGPRRHRGY